jgi:hypothetical protein
MFPDIRWIIAQYGFGPDETHIGCPETGRTQLQSMADELIGTSGLLAIYIPLGTPSGYEPGAMCGRVVGAVRLCRMPRGRRMEDYYYENLEGERQWPIGWPCKAVYAPDVSLCPSFREHVENYLHDPESFQFYTHRFEFGPFELEEEMRKRLNRDFAQFDALD